MSAKNENNGNVMTREQKLYAMRMVDLVEVAEKLGVKIDKKGKKSTAVLKILKAEESVSGDGIPLAEVGKEILEQAKKKAQQAKKRKKASTKKEVKSNNIENVEKIVAFFDDYANKHKDDIYYANNMNMRTYKLVGGKGYARLDFNKSCVWFGANSKALNDVKVKTPDKIRKHTFDYAWSISDLNDKTKKFIVDILDNLREYQINRKDKTKNSKKEEN